MKRLLAPLLTLFVLLAAAPAQAAPRPAQPFVGHHGIVVEATGSTFVALEGSTVPRAKKKPFAPGLRRGDRGPDVRGAQLLLSGGKPSHYPSIHPFRGRKITGQYGKFTAKAVLRARWLLGEPVTYRAYCRCRPGKRAVFDRDLYLILTGKRARPLGWISLRSKRISLARHVTVGTATSPCALAIVRTARSQVGVHEIPWRSNRGPRISYPVAGVPSYESSTGAYGLAWCASFAMWDVDVMHGAWPWPRSAGVYALVDEAQQHTHLRSTPTVGALVAYVRWTGRIRVDAGHIGVVERVTKDGFWTIEGNSTRYRGDPWGGAVVRHFRRFGDATVFLVPTCPTPKR